MAVDELSLEVADGEFMILVGPSGCGKTTALRMVAGLEEVTSRRHPDRRQVVNTLDPVDRDIAMVFQNYALYPHMSVRDNIAFPLRMQRLPKSEREQRVGRRRSCWASRTCCERKPRELSGGQRQRVAMGRAIIRHPQAFLMDEPLSNLDAKLRVQMRAELVKLHRRLGVTTLYVTHDQTEAMTLGQRVAVLNRGVLQQVDTPQAALPRPGEHVRGGLHRQPVDELPAGEARARRRRARSHPPRAAGGACERRLVREPDEVLLGSASGAFLRCAARRRPRRPVIHAVTSR